MSNISVFGLGYVGTVTACCLAHQGNRVIGVDLSSDKVKALQAGHSPIVEPGIDDLVAKGRATLSLKATSDSNYAIAQTDISFLCVGTPGLRNGKLDLGYLDPVCRQVGEGLKRKNSFHLIVLRSTALPGTVDSLLIPALEQSSGKRMGEDFGVCVNPEFMREGSAVADFLNPAMTVIGTAHASHAEVLRKLYRWVTGPVFQTSFRAAEMIKYVSNTWHAVKVVFANEIGTLAKGLDVDTESLLEMFTADTKLNISPLYLKPGFAFGGSCLPKDLRALNYRARELDLALPLLDSVLASNEKHLQRAVDMILGTGKRSVAVLGLSFKPATDDLRESPLVELVKRLLGEGRVLRIWDENVSLGRLIGSNQRFIEEVIPHIGSLLSADLGEVLRTSEVIVIGTRGIGIERLRGGLRSDHVVIDLVNLEKARRVDPHAVGLCW